MTRMEQLQNLCSHCGKPITPEEFYCPSCGKQLKEKPPSTSVGRQIFIYLLSILIPPWGLYPASKYLKQDDPTSKSIGAFALFLTVISIGIAIMLAFQISEHLNEEVSRQLRMYQGY